MRPRILAAVALVASTPAVAQSPQPAETIETAIDRVFNPAFQLKMMLSGPLDQHPITRAAFAALGRQRGCAAYRDAWRGAFDRHLSEWRQSYQAAVRSVVPEDVLLREPRRFMDPAITAAYSERVVAALRNSDAISTVRTMGSEILGQLQSAAAAGSGNAGTVDINPGAPGGIAQQCGVSLEYLQGRETIFG
jgi:hypothetical protein